MKISRQEKNKLYFEFKNISALFSAFFLFAGAAAFWFFFGNDPSLSFFRFVYPFFFLLGMLFLLMFYSRSLEIDFDKKVLTVTQKPFVSVFLKGFKNTWQLDQITSFAANFVNIQGHPSPAWKQSLVMQLKSGEEVEIFYSIFYPIHKVLEILEEEFHNHSLTINIDYKNAKKENASIRLAVIFFIICLIISAIIILKAA